MLVKKVMGQIKFFNKSTLFRIALVSILTNRVYMEGIIKNIWILIRVCQGKMYGVQNGYLTEVAQIVTK